eukprot:m.183109 g.183109  ORF g.183109 m.183109 type:complete len:156 (+) comp18075_c0_seq3:148-615(+)
MSAEAGEVDAVREQLAMVSATLDELRKSGAPETDEQVTELRALQANLSELVKLTEKAALAQAKARLLGQLGSKKKDISGRGSGSGGGSSSSSAAASSSSSSVGVAAASSPRTNVDTWNTPAAVAKGSRVRAVQQSFHLIGHNNMRMCFPKHPIKP